MKLKMVNSLIVLTGAIIMLIFQGCDESGGITVPSGASSLTVSVKSDDNADANLVITEAKLLIADVEFEKLSNGKDELHQKGPFVFGLDINGSVKEMGTQYIIRDNYTKIKFNIHKPADTETPSDPEFKEGTAENQRYSFIIKGTYNGSNFVYKSKKAVSIVINFIVAENINLKQTNVTILFNKLKWFKNGTADIDPRDPQNENIIDENIKTSFVRIFRDDNKDGVPD